MSSELPEVRASHMDRDHVVDVLRIASGEGRLTSEELDSRLGAALTAQTVGELQELVRDLPQSPQVKDEMVIDQSGGKAVRDGGWVVPHCIKVRSEQCKVVLDFTEAVITSPVLQVNVDVNFGSLRLVTVPGIVIDVTDGLRLKHSKLKLKQAADELDSPQLRIKVVGKLRHSKIVEKRR